MKAWAKSFYLSAAWEQTRAAYLMSQDYICERCGQPAKIVHHKRWLNRENINDISVTLCWDNLEALCQDCHNNGVMDIWNMAHVEDGEKYYIRKEYTEVSELQNSNGKPQIIIQQAPIATGQQAEPQQTPPAAAGEPAGGLGEKEGINNAD